MNIERPAWTPRSFKEAEEDLRSKVIRESHYLEFKAEFGGGEAGTGKIRKALASLANDGGVLVVGVEEDKATVRAERLVPVQLAGLVERIEGVAASLDPPLHLERAVELEDPNDPARGIVVVRVPVSLMAPHQVPSGMYYARDERRAHVMPDAMVERLMRQREERANRVARSLDETVKDLSRGDRGFTPSASLFVGCFTLAAEPVPVRDQHLLAARLADNNSYSRWLEEHMEVAKDRAGRLIGLHQDLAQALYSGGWSPDRGVPRYARTMTGVERATTGEGHEPEIPVRDILAIDESGAVRLSSNYIIYPERGDDRRVLAWRTVLSAAVWTLGLLDSITAEAGYRAGVAIAVHVELMNTVPEEPADGVVGRARDIRASTRESYPGATYQGQTLVPLAEIGGDLRGAMDRLFGQMLRNLVRQPPFGIMAGVRG
ncbi:ATP-binding protein [Verrucosispora sp. WMMA2121]|uniref:AlbA family DNA-binding domain-containing protein n=1 Tax=Verrucosispora sp. WMMA2121 TaxID=3015164 RepID=UPI0022B655F2|nr:ATP-binding protein [Verrucosispora sp. WMMA2121]MCZ7420053.1 ATP-binding protein [Verrucosispora sp. WMMA2121]